MNDKNETKSTNRVLRVSVTVLVFGILIGVLVTGSAAGQQAVIECQELSTPGQAYELTQDIENSTIDTCISITADNILLDGQGFEVNGTNKTTDSIGVAVNSANNVTVKNVGNSTRWENGIVVGESTNATLTNNTANNNGRNGIATLTIGSNLTDNTANGNDLYGIQLSGSTENELTGNTANGNGVYGIWLSDGSDFNNLTDNVARDNSGNAEGSSAGIYLGGVQLSNPVNNNTLIDNTATGDQTTGIYLSQTNDTELRGNTANSNNFYGIWLDQKSLRNELIDNTANFNGDYGIWLSGESNFNELTGNEANLNGNFGGIASKDTSTETANGVGIYLGGLAPVSNNTLTDNTANENNLYGIWLSEASDNKLVDNTARFNGRYGFWLIQGSSSNNLTDNLAEFNGDLFVLNEESPTAGFYLDGGSFTGVSDNVLVDNTARENGYGIWIRNSFDNDVSESLAEDNGEGIAVEVQELQRLGETVSPETIESTGNTFTNDVSRNNDWDFVVDTPSELAVEDTDIDVSDAPVTNLDIGASTKPGTTLSFEANNIRLRSVSNPQPDPGGLSNVGRYFEAERIPETTGPFLAVAVNYTDADLAGVDESTLEILRYNETANEWQVPSFLPVPDPTALDTEDNLVAVATDDFSNFGVFGEQACINRRNLGRGQEDQECPFDQDIGRSGSRRGLDRSSGRAGDGIHSDSDTARRDRSRGEGPSR